MLKFFLHKARATKLCRQKFACKVKLYLATLLMASNCFAAQNDRHVSEITSIIAAQNLEDKKGLIRAITPAELEKLKKYQIYNDLCDDVITRIVAVEVEYVDFHQKINRGLIYVFDAIAPLVVDLFKDLQKNKIPVYGISAFEGAKFITNNKITNIIPQTNYNYTGSFACRNSRGLNSRSMHAAGMAIDFNPLQNPFLQIDDASGKVVSVHPFDGVKNVNKKTKLRINPKQKGFIDAKTQKIFAKHLFVTWGGNWHSPVDYHHFELDKQVANLLKIAPLAYGKIIIELITQNNTDDDKINKIKELFKSQSSNSKQLTLAEHYTQNPNNFMQKIILELNTEPNTHTPPK